MISKIENDSFMIQAGTIRIIWPDRSQEETLGGKGDVLRKLAQSGIPVPPFFCVKRNKVRNNGLGLKFDFDAREAIRSAITRLGSAPWAVRSSAVGEDSKTSSYAGIFRSVLSTGDAKNPSRSSSVLTMSKSTLVSRILANFLLYAE